jgi:protein TonB
LAVPVQEVIGWQDYPSEALRKEQTGSVTIAIDVSASGKPDRCQVTESSGFVQLQRAACAAYMKRARYEPARDDTDGRSPRSA